MIGIGTLLFLVGALGVALGFEAVNGCHDTANAVATVIYTKSMRPQVAVVWSGLMNFSGVMIGGIAVAYSIVHLLPVDLLVHIDTGAGMSMVMALLLAAILWNLGTWWLGIPASSSHTLVGAIIGVGMANSFLMGHFGSGVNWKKAGEVGLSLMISPLIGFVFAGTLLWLFKKLVKSPSLHEAPQGDKPPVWWVRGILMLTCTGVSFFHGSNDGQKGVGLIMLILIGLVPASFAVNMAETPQEFHKVADASEGIHQMLYDPDVREKLAETRPIEDMQLAVSTDPESPSNSATDLPKQYGLGDPDVSSVGDLLGSLHSDVADKEGPDKLDDKARWQVRTKILLIEQGLTKLQSRLSTALNDEKMKTLNGLRADLRHTIEYAPWWVIAGVALALGIGTMVGWKRIVVTVGEKIGKTHLTYSQGASAELVAMSTIGLADMLGMPVSTTHVLSSGVAGSMAANKSGLQWSTIRSILLAWVLTLPVAMLLAGGLFLLFHLFV